MKPNHNPIGKWTKRGWNTPKRPNTKRLSLSKDKKIKLVKIKLKTRHNEYLKLDRISYFFAVNPLLMLILSI